MSPSAKNQVNPSAKKHVNVPMHGNRNVECLEPWKLKTRHYLRVQVSTYTIVRDPQVSHKENLMEIMKTSTKFQYTRRASLVQVHHIIT